MAETTVFSACPHDCPDTCAMLTTVRDGKVIDVRGNPDHPFTQGGLCVKVNDYQNRVYSEDRVLYPMRRVGAKGSGEFERISWDEALDAISSRWNAIIDEDGPSAILPYSYLGTEGILNGLHVGDAFFNKLGAAVSERTFCDSGAITAFFMTCGPTAAVDPESFVYSKYIVLWAINTISTNLHHWPFIAEAQRRGAKVVVIDPVATRTAKKADWHIPIKPGTDAALALGMINVIIAEDLVDHDYVEQYTVGYDELAARAANFPPDVVAGITGIAADDIRTLAREFATTQPSVIRMGVAIERNASGGNAVRALSCLPALVGSWRHCGGGILHMPIWAFPVKFDDLSRADWIREGTPVINQWRLGAALMGELDQEVSSLFVYNANPVVMVPEQAKVLQGLAREDLFTVVSEHFVTDTARYADIVLPATTQLEQFDLMFSWGHLYLTLNEPAIAPCGEIRTQYRAVPPLGARDGLQRSQLGSDGRADGARCDGLEQPRARRESISPACARPAMPASTSARPKSSSRTAKATSRRPPARSSSSPPSPKAPATWCCRCSAKAMPAISRARRWIPCPISFRRMNRRGPVPSWPRAILSTCCRRRRTPSSIRPSPTCRPSCIMPANKWS